MGVTLAYRKDIDGLRALSVLLVMLFHLDIQFVSGGYIGVDIFFVISGYLITSILYSEIKQKKFSFQHFYVKRAARLLPSLVLMAALSFILAFFLYSSPQLDSFGKELVFGLVGLANIHYGLGIGYFETTEIGRPLIHLWSLGVEEQFYLIWPLILIVICRAVSHLRVHYITIGLMLIFFMWSIVGALEHSTGSYFFPQYRFFELLIGANTALLLCNKKVNDVIEKLPFLIASILTLTAMGMIFYTALIFDSNTLFPGFNALVPCICAASLLILKDTYVHRVLSYKPLVYIGLISYPLYLLHQPFFVFAKEVSSFLDGSYLFSAVAILLTFGLAVVSFEFLEKPIRASVKGAGVSTSKLNFTILNLVFCTFLLVGLGAYAAKSGGISWRYEYLNLFAGELEKKVQLSFPAHFKEGWNVTGGSDKRMLVIGDSVAQHYAWPLTLALGYEPEEVDTISKGGCWLMLGKQPDTNLRPDCVKLKKQLTGLSSEHKYDVIMITQRWIGYHEDDVTMEYWEKELSETISFLEDKAEYTLIIGSHVKVGGIQQLQPRVFLDEDSYRNGLFRTSLTNFEHVQRSKDSVNNFIEKVNSKTGNVKVIYPLDIFCDGSHCRLHDDSLSYFYDSIHLSSVATSFVSERLSILLQ